MSASTDERNYRTLPLDAIYPPANPSREQMDEHKLEELAGSIRLHGVLLPLIVARHGERYEIIAGHRRYLAARRASQVSVPCLVYSSTTSAHEAVMYAENKHREDLSAAEEAIWFAELLESRCQGDTERLADLVGEKRAYVEGRLTLFQGDEEVFNALRARKIPIGVAQHLNRVTDTRHCRYLLDAAIRGGATVAIVVGWIADWERSRSQGNSSEGFVSAAPLPGAAVPASPFTCYSCGGKENIHLMRPLYFHEYCILAVLDKLLAAYRGEQSVAG